MGTMKSIAEALDVPVDALFTSERSLLEAEMVRIFRQLPVERQKGWLDMAHLAAQDHQ